MIPACSCKICDSTVNGGGGQDDHPESGNPQEPSEVEVGDLSYKF